MMNIIKAKVIERGKGKKKVFYLRMQPNVGP